MIKMTFQVAEREMLDTIHALEMDTHQKIRHVLEAIGTETIAFLRSLTENMADPIRPGEGQRRKHPGNWADITGNLANAYAHRVVEIVGGWSLELSNSMDYAVYLEARDGMFVLKGVTEQHGPVEQALRKVVARIAPDWTVTNG